MSFIDEKEIAAAMSVKLDFDVLPEKATFQEGIRRAPDRGFRLTQAQTEIALKNALRYIPKKFHQELIPEFLEELLVEFFRNVTQSVFKGNFSLSLR